MPRRAAAEPIGCDKFKWPVERERAALARADTAKVQSGAAVTAKTPIAVTIALTPFGSAALPQQPERVPATETFAGFVKIDVLLKGTYSVSLSDGGWIDAVQNGRLLKPVSFSGVTGCDGIRKVVRFDIEAGPLLLQVTGVASSAIVIAVLPISE